MYLKLQKNMSESMLTRYYRWIFEKRETDSLKSLQSCVIQEAEFRMIRTETHHGLHSSFKQEWWSHLIWNVRQPGKITAKWATVCDGQHRIWNCKKYNKYQVKKSRLIAKEKKLCYSSLEKNHWAGPAREQKLVE